MLVVMMMVSWCHGRVVVVVVDGGGDYDIINEIHRVIEKSKQWWEL